MILHSKTFDQDMLAKMRQHDPVVVFYCAFSQLIDQSPFTFCSYFSSNAVILPILKYIISKRCLSKLSKTKNILSIFEPFYCGILCPLLNQDLSIMWIQKRPMDLISKKQCQATVDSETNNAAQLSLFYKISFMKPSLLSKGKFMHLAKQSLLM